MQQDMNGGNNIAKFRYKIQENRKQPRPMHGHLKERCGFSQKQISKTIGLSFTRPKHDF